MVAETVTRVSEHTPEQVQQQIQSLTEKNVMFYASGGSESIDRRLAELNQEWDIERVLEGWFSGVIMTSLVFGIIGGRKWHLLTLAAGGFLMQHVLQGWCPPLNLLRHLGFRTANEIDEERYALKAIRGDFENIASAANGDWQGAVRRAIAAVHPK